MDSTLVELCPPNQIAIYKAIIRDPELGEALEIVFEEIEDRYTGDYTVDEPSDLSMLLLLAKRCYQDSRFEASLSKLHILIEELSAMAQGATESMKSRPLDLQAMPPSPKDDSSARNALLSMQLALQLGEKVSVILSNDDTEPMEVTLSGYPQQKDREFARLWFTFDQEMLSKRVRWERLVDVISHDVWDLTGAV